jgi:hypothetical protein
MSRAAAVSARRTLRPAKSRHRPDSTLARYLADSQMPLASLLLVLPLLILHEIGVHWFSAVPGRVVEYRVTALTLLTDFFHAFGAYGRYLPALAVVAVLLSWHIARRDRWAFNIPLLPLMALEGMLWAVPLIGAYFLGLPKGPSYLPVGDWKLMASLYLGAGVYEELIFRLAAFALLSLLLNDIWRLPHRWVTPVIVLLAAIAFSGYHMLSFVAFPWQAFVFITLRGVYYGIIFLERGFGITVLCHTAYDLFFLALTQVNGH